MAQPYLRKKIEKNILRDDGKRNNGGTTRGAKPFAKIRIIIKLN